MSLESGGKSDTELISAMVSRYGPEACANPSKISVRRVDTKALVPATGGKQTFAVYDTVKGFQCLQSQQSDGSPCLDYEVQWCCPGYFGFSFILLISNRTAFTKPQNDGTRQTYGTNVVQVN
jgi:hypothetical protein